ncbi:plant intracellular Ras-group-related LRR protein 6-like isoform X2 [Impatiens glandulifera]|uniref:plant intracellular Ras-group-related LRR protein 6-like isoform X2 n=1 Tax=Impatiens glandulifera TaxID=253017 RepID=UPI001FB17407|nr:plant intracellular Ras-group-related LRR protein 6-like isoform X2 [Impatiens glandulifera]
MGEIRKEKHWQLFWLCVVDLFLNKSKTFRFPSMDRFLKDARASGSLNLSNRSLSEVPNEVYKSMDAIGGSEKWWETVELHKLILAHNNIESLREDLRNLPLLSVLNVRHNKLSLLPAAIGELHMLKSLDVSFNMIFLAYLKKLDRQLLWSSLNAQIIN